MFADNKRSRTVRSISIVIVAVLLAPVLFAQTSVRPQRLRPAPNVIFQDTTATQFLLPVVGSVPGANGTVWHSSTVISNFRDASQRVAFTFLKQGAAVSAPVYRTLVPYANGGDIGLVSDDIVQTLGFSGLGSLLVQAVDANGNLDPNGKIDGFSRIWTDQPATSACASPSGTMSQSAPAVPVNGLVGSQFSAFSVGSRQDDNYRTNVGLVNLSNAPQTFRVNIFGSNNFAEADFNVTVPAMSMVQTAIPAGNFGTMSVIFALLGSNVSTVNWAAYATTVDNRTGDSWLRNAAY